MSTHTNDVTAETEARLFMASPAQYFGHSSHAMHHIAPDRLADLQTEALNLRFTELREAIPVLRTLADEQGISQIDSLEDAPRVLFQHSVYKSYPASLLEAARFRPLTRWLDRLSTLDLASLDVDDCNSLDQWLSLLDERMQLMLVHSSGTSGRMSFLPRSAAESSRWMETLRCELFEYAGLGDAGNHPGEHFDIVWPTYRFGRTALMRIIQLAAEHVAGSEDRVHALRPGWMSSDAMFVAARLAAAQARGEQLEITPALRERRDEFRAAQRALAGSMDRFFAEVVESLRGKRVWFLGTWTLVHDVARAGIDRGVEGIFAPDSVVTTSGGAKGQVLPDDWERQVARYAGVSRLHHAYGMTEMMGVNSLCDRGRYHINPWMIPMVLDPDDGSLLHGPGERTGRFAFVDLMAETYWGGFITGDEASLSEQPCACGRTTPHIAKEIERYSAKRGGDDKITCAAAGEAHDRALEYLGDNL
jgi:hypothetical protein